MDLGLGSGHFLHVCQSLGHRCVGLDQEGASDYICSVRRSLGVSDVVEHTITPLQPLSPFSQRFDLVTSYRCRFYYIGEEGRLWTLAEWDFFLNDLRDNVLQTNARFVLHMPPVKRDKWGLCLDPKVIKLFQERGAVPIGNALLFEPLR